MSGELPSQVEETLAICPRFRIVLVGNSGVGKSSLVSSVFNIVFNVSLPDEEDGTGIDIAHDRAGKADINHEYFSLQNPRFILHDSMGFEPGSTEKSEIVRSFLKDRAANEAALPDQVHAIWLCIETPRTGSRLLQTGDEDLLDLAKQLNIPVIVVFTKYDLLIMEHFRAASHIKVKEARLAEARQHAEASFKEVTKQLLVPFVPVSVSNSATNRQLRDATLVELTQVTRDHLRDVAGSLWALWATAQQINARQKVELSISEGFKKYWRDLGESVLFEGHTMDACVHRIHDDILKVWNFNDPHKVLPGAQFFTEMIAVVEPLRIKTEVSDNQQVDKMAGLAANVATVAGAVGGSLILPALGSMLGTLVLKFLSSKYRRGASTSLYLSAYIVDLILVLHEISMVVRVDPPRVLTAELVMDAMETYKSEAGRIHSKLEGSGVAFPVKAEERIVKVILDTLGM